MIHAEIYKLRKWFDNHAGSITAFSGGIDSALVLYLSHYFLGEAAIGCISVSPSLKKKDYAGAMAFCKQYGIRLEVIETKEIEDPSYVSNPADRCYYCKSHLYQDIALLASQYPDYSILNGTNVDDFQDYRPGIRAATEFKIYSPLADCDLGKSGVRRLAKHFNLPIWDKPASPCLSSRIPYGNLITPHKLQQVEAAEAILNDYGFLNVRVRHYGKTAKIEVPITDIDRLLDHHDPILRALQTIGFETVQVDEEGLVSGKLNRSLHHLPKN